MRSRSRLIQFAQIGLVLGLMLSGPSAAPSTKAEGAKVSESPGAGAPEITQPASVPPTSTPPTTAPPPPVASSEAPWGGQSSFTGAGSCGSAQCHGSPKARDQFRVRQNEFIVWATNDKHSKAWRVLSNDRSKQIMANLKVAKRADEYDRCLDCHALKVPQGRRGGAFVLSDGVSCESCHGPAEGWLGPHTVKGWTHEQSVARGMYDLRSVVHRSEKCLSCHLGSSEKLVDHELIAAGHPDLYFELDSFSGGMPQHWNEPDPWMSVRAWTVGQAVSLREAMKLLQHRVSDDTGWPDFAEYECFACHHDLKRESKDSWRQSRGYPDKAGQPPWNRSRHILLRAVLLQMAPAEADALDGALRTLEGLMAGGGRDRQKIAQTAGSIQSAVEPLIKRLSEPGTALSPEGAKALLRGVVAESLTIAGSGYRVAEQIFMAVDTLARPLADSGKLANRAEVRKAIDDLLRDLEDFGCRRPQRGRDAKSGSPACPDTPYVGAACYDPKAFIEHLKELEKRLSS